MFVIDKELLRPDVVYYPRTGPVAFSGEDLAEICRSSKALLASGRYPPIPLEHRDDAKPVKMSREDDLSELTRHNTGWVQDFYRNPDGSLWAKLGVLDPDIAAKIKDGRIKYVSPEITPVLPADGTVHRNVVTHVAITHQPVWAGQTPFHVPPGWAGSDGAVTPRPARMSLLQGGPIRLSMADAEPPEEVLAALQFGYRIPGGKSGKGAWFKGVYYPTHIPQKVLTGAEPDELKGLLRKLASRHGQRVPRDFAGLLEPGESKEYPSEVQSLPASHLSLHDELPPFRRPHKGGEPVLAWEDPEGGHTHVVSGHDFVKKMAPQEGATVPTLRVHAKSPYEARGAALMYHLQDGSADPEDLAGLFMDGADPKELRAALQESGCSPDEPCFHKAEYLAGLREDDPDATLADRPPQGEPKQFGETSGPAEVAAPETLFSHASGYDPGEHRWQHWLQSHFDDPAERASFAAEHGKSRPATHADFLARADQHERQSMSRTRMSTEGGQEPEFVGRRVVRPGMHRVVFRGGKGGVNGERHFILSEVGQESDTPSKRRWDVAEIHPHQADHFVHGQAFDSASTMREAIEWAKRAAESEHDRRVYKDFETRNDPPSTHGTAANPIKVEFSSGASTMDYFEMTKPKDEPEGEEKPKGEGKKDEGGEKPEKKGDGPPKKDAPEAPKAAEHKFQSILKKLEGFKVHLPADKIKSAEDLVEQLETALHALEGAGAAEGAMDMGGDGGKPPQLEAEQGSTFMSLKTDNEALKKALLEEASRNEALASLNSSLVFSVIEKDTDGMQQKGLCTKAKRDELLARIKEISGKQRFSLISPKQSPEMAEIFAEIRVLKSLPEGTFLPKRAQAAAQTQAEQDYRALLFSNTPPPATNGNGTSHLQAEANPHAVATEALPDGVPVEPEKKAEFDQAWKGIRMSLGIKD